MCCYSSITPITDLIMKNTSVRSASPRQLWALYCITKRDYRNDGLSFEEASALIKKYGKKNYEKKPAGKTMEEQFLEFYKANIMPSVVASLNVALGIQSVVAEDTNFMKGTGENGTAKTYNMRGFGCSISYLDYDKRSKKAKELEEVFRSVRFKKCRELVESQFPKRLINQLEKEGTPLGALYCQDYDVNSTLFNGVVRFAKEVLKINSRFDYVTRLD